ncbi:MAG: response regulator transcription factor [Eubacteriales bacterium]|nr:response regulator transcription factor [Eubacteriales bacterium]
MPKILVVEDDIDLNNLIRTVLEGKGHEVFSAQNGKIALDTLDTTHIDLIISDIMMPQLDGFSMLTDLRQANMEMPVLLITAKGSLADKSKGFSSGADDYMVKPIDIKELELRVNALLRRSRIANERRLRMEDVILDADTLTVTKDQDVQILSPKEFYLLFKLLSYPGRVFTRFEIMSEIWGYDSESDEKTINVHISKLRSRFENWPEFEILTIRGLGYKAIVRGDIDAGK